MTNSLKEEIKKNVGEIIAQHYDFVPEQFSNAENYAKGCVIVMDCKDAMDIDLDSAGLIQDGYMSPESTLKLLDVYLSQYEFEEDETAQECSEAFIEYIGENVFFRFKDSSSFKALNDVLKAVREFSFWSPIYVMLDGTWYDTYGVDTEDDDGNTVGIRL